MDHLGFFFRQFEIIEDVMMMAPQPAVIDRRSKFVVVLQHSTLRHYDTNTTTLTKNAINHLKPLMIT